MKDLLRLIKESKKILPHANYEQKKLILKMLETAKNKLEKNKVDNSPYLLNEADYLQEK